MRSIFVSFTLGRASVVTTHLTGQAFPGIYLRHSRLELRTSSRKLCTCNLCTCSCTCTLSDESLLAGRGGPICPVRGRSRMCLVSIQWKLEQWNVSLGGRFTWAGRNFPVGGEVVFCTYLLHLVVGCNYITFTDSIPAVPQNDGMKIAKQVSDTTLRWESSCCCFGHVMVM